MAITTIKLTNKIKQKVTDVHLEFKNGSAKILGLDGISPTDPNATFSVDGQEYDNPKSITNIEVDDEQSITIRVENREKELPKIDPEKSYWTIKDQPSEGSFKIEGTMGKASPHKAKTAGK